MVEELKKKIDETKAEVQESWRRIDELGKGTPQSLPKPKEQKKLEDKSNVSPLKRAMTKVGLKKDGDKEGGDWTRVKSNID